MKKSTYILRLDMAREKGQIEMPSIKDQFEAFLLAEEQEIPLDETNLECLEAYQRKLEEFER